MGDLFLNWILKDDKSFERSKRKYNLGRRYIRRYIRIWAEDKVTKLKKKFQGSKGTSSSLV